MYLNVESTFVRNVKANIEALRGFSIYIFCPSFFSIRRVSSNTVLFAIVYLINKERIATSVVVNYYINISACVMSREGVSLNYASYTDR